MLISHNVLDMYTSSVYIHKLNVIFHSTIVGHLCVLELSVVWSRIYSFMEASFVEYVPKTFIIIPVVPGVMVSFIL